MLGMVRSKYLHGGLHGCEGAAISVGALGSFRSAVARAVWSKKLPMTNTPALLSLLDGPWRSDPAFFFIWSRLRKIAFSTVGLCLFWVPWAWAHPSPYSVS